MKEKFRKFLDNVWPYWAHAAMFLLFWLSLSFFTGCAENPQYIKVKDDDFPDVNQVILADPGDAAQFCYATGKGWERIGVNDCVFGCWRPFTGTIMVARDTAVNLLETIIHELCHAAGEYDVEECHKRLPSRKCGTELKNARQAFKHVGRD